MSDKSKKKQKKNVKPKPQIKAKKAVSKQNSDSSTAKNVNPLEPPILNKAQKEKLRRDLEIVKPQIISLAESFDAQRIVTLSELVQAYTAPISQMQEQIRAIANVGQQAAYIIRRQQEAIAQVVEPMIRMQETIREATMVYQSVFKQFNAQFSVLAGLMVKINLSDHEETFSKQSRTIYDYDELNSSYDFQSNELSTSAKVSTEVETKTILYKHTRNVNFKLGIFEKDIVGLDIRLERVEANQNLMLENQHKILSHLMDGQERVVTANDLSSSDEDLDLMLFGKPIGLEAGSNMQLLAGALFGVQKQY